MANYYDENALAKAACDTLRKNNSLETVNQQIKFAEDRLAELKELKTLLEKNPEFERMISLMRNI